MRILLSIILFFFMLLITIEDFLAALYDFLKRKLLALLSGIERFENKSGHEFKRSVQRITILWGDLKQKLKRKKKRKKKTRSLFAFQTKIKYFILGSFFSCLFIFIPIAFFLFVQDLPNPNELTLREVPQTTKIYDRNGTLLTEIYASQNRTLVKLSEIPKSLQMATLAIEDKNFYNHPGFDLPSILRAFREDIVTGNIQGGSTLTQQLIKTSMLTPEQTLSRKLKEVVLAFWAERIYTKNQILEMYFNQVPYGGTAWGAEAAAETYFNKPVMQLRLSESAFLAGLTAAPTSYSPFGENPTLWKKRQKEVLARMVSLHYISQAEANAAQKEKLVFRQPQTAIHAPHFVNYIKDLLIKKYGLAAVEKGGLQVTTTLDLKTQEMAEKAVKEEVENAAALNVSNGAAVVIDPRNGDLLAMVGSKDFLDPNGGNVNLTTSLRQPGSTVKVITYTAALLQGFTAASLLDDSPQSFSVPGGEPYTPVNYDGNYHGQVPLRFALANSLNLPAVKLLSEVGVPNVVALAKKMGITSWNDPNDYGLSLTLGAAETTMLEMAQVNSVLANKGNFVGINPIIRVKDIKDTIFEEKQPDTARKVVDEGVTFILSDILSDNNARSTAFGSHSPLMIPGHRVSVKTGTSDDKRDNWTNGYTDNYVVVVWVGNNDNSPMSQTLASGITGAAPIWNRIMTKLLAKHPESKLQIPDTIVQRTCGGKPEYFIKGTEERGNCNSMTTPSVPYSFPEKSERRRFHDH